MDLPTQVGQIVEEFVTSFLETLFTFLTELFSQLEDLFAGLL